MLSAARTLGIAEVFCTSSHHRSRKASACFFILQSECSSSSFPRNSCDGLERTALRVAAARLRAHYAAFGNDVPGQVAASFVSGAALGFHGYCYERTILKAHADRRAQLLDKLERVQATVVSGGA